MQAYTQIFTHIANTYYVCRSRVVSAAEVCGTVDGSVKGRISD